MASHNCPIKDIIHGGAKEKVGPPAIPAMHVVLGYNTSARPHGRVQAPAASGGSSPGSAPTCAGPGYGPTLAWADAHPFRTGRGHATVHTW